MSDDTTSANGGGQETQLAESRSTAVVACDRQAPPVLEACKRPSRRSRGSSKARKRRRRAQGARSPSPATDAQRTARKLSPEFGNNSVSDAGGTSIADTSEEATSTSTPAPSTVDNGEAHGASEPTQMAQTRQDGGGSGLNAVRQEDSTDSRRLTSVNGTQPRQPNVTRPFILPERLYETAPWDGWSQPTYDFGPEPRVAATSTLVASGLQSGNDNATDSRRDRRKSFVRFGATTIREITQRTRSALAWNGGQQHMLMALVAVVMLLLSLAVLILIFVRVEEPLVLTRCSSTSCRNAARDLERFVDVGVDPCKDFYGHVCRRWEQDAAAAPKDDANAAVILASNDFLDAHWRFMLARINTSLHESAAETVAHQEEKLFRYIIFPELRMHVIFIIIDCRFCHRFLLSPNISLAAMLESLKVDIPALQVLLRAPDPTSQLRAAITLSLTLGVHVGFSLDIVHSVSHGATQLRVFKARTKKRNTHTLAHYH
ncbi:hypothetical protein HPB49_012558 [Dermacentor silvarum]|uniref:Uncharacterized protein n=1 Tax=Dermacentor silvarum TaxID=543639 RepID=A0ACB8CXA6_DERSI|nr:hypothetical protein HPB49_012558 [Dermacentor silvarum]